MIVGFPLSNSAMGKRLLIYMYMDVDISVCVQIQPLKIILTVESLDHIRNTGKAIGTSEKLNLYFPPGPGRTASHSPSLAF